MAFPMDGIHWSIQICLKEIKEITAKLCDFSYKLSDNILVCQLFDRVTWRFHANQVLTGRFTQIWCLSA